MPLDSSCSYVAALHSLQEDTLLDAGSILALWLWGEPNEPLLDGLSTFDERQRHPRWSSIPARRQLGLDLIARADDLMTSRSAAERGAVAHRSASWLAAETANLADIFAQWAMEDAVWGGSLEPFRRPALVSREGRPHRKVMTRLHDPTFIREYVAGCGEHVLFLRPASEAVRRRVAAIPAELVAPGLADEHVAMGQAFAAENRRGIMAAVFGEKAEAPRRRRERRKIIKRSSMTAAALLGVDMVSRFSRGEEVRLRGKTADFLIERNGGLAGQGAHQLQVMVAEPGGRRLAGLCVYVPETPALDQLAALGLAVAAGEEMEIIKVANVTAVMPGMEQHPLLAGKKLPSNETWRDRMMQRPDRYDDRRLVAGYVGRTRCLYIHETHQLVMR